MGNARRCELTDNEWKQVKELLLPEHTEKKANHGKIIEICYTLSPIHFLLRQAEQRINAFVKMENLSVTEYKYHGMACEERCAAA